MEDRAIVEMYLHRNEDAIIETNKKYHSYCKSIARNIIDSVEDIQEILNDTWLHTWNSIPPNTPSNLKTYVGKITRNLSFNAYKKKHAQKRNSQITLVLDELEEIIPSTTNLPEQELYKKEMLQIINSYLHTLPKQQRQIFVLRYFYVESIKDIADTFHISENKVSVLLHRLRKQLYERLKMEGYLYE